MTTLQQLAARIAPKCHWLIIGIGQFPVFRRDVPAVLRDPRRDQAAHRNRLPRSEIDWAAIGGIEGELDKPPCDLGYRKIIPYLFSPRHWKFLLTRHRARPYRRERRC